KLLLEGLDSLTVDGANDLLTLGSGPGIRCRISGQQDDGEEYASNRQHDPELRVARQHTLGAFAAVIQRGGRGWRWASALAFWCVGFLRHAPFPC
ncbi:MAG: hypothetical protein ACRD2X_03470, partial [Vicinamibacteraceae bacterium]